MKHLIRLAPLLCLGLIAPLLHAAPSISAEIHPAEVQVGQAAQLIVRVSGAGRGARPVVPDVNGVQIRAAGQSSQISIINGITSSSVSYRYRVVPDHTGDYTIPAISITANGKQYQTSPLALKALAAAPGSRAVAPDEPDAVVLPGKSAYLDLRRMENAKRDHLYVGESTPIAIRAFLRADIRVTSVQKPTIASQAYTIDLLSDEPEQKLETIDGVRYRVITWYGKLSAVKAGEHPFKSELKATISVPEKSRPDSRRRRGGAFDDPFFDDFFKQAFTRYTQREITLESKKSKITVKSLPTAGRPADFSGAIGDFTLTSEGMPPRLKTGNPTHFNVTVHGEGTFDRMSAPALRPEGAWKTYTPKEEFRGEDILGFKGSKVFQIPAIAREPGDHQVYFSLSFFDPDTGEYRHAETRKTDIAVTGKSIAAETNAAASEAPGVPESQSPLMAGLGRVFADAAPLYKQAWFLVLQGCLATVTLVACVLLMVRAHGEAHPERAEQRTLHAAVEAQKKAADRARTRGDVPAFFTAARSALQLELSHHRGCKPEAVTSAEVADHYAAGTPVARIFATADAIEYSGESIDADTLAAWQQTLNGALEDLRRPGTAEEQPAADSWGQVSPTS